MKKNVTFILFSSLLSSVSVFAGNGYSSGYYQNQNPAYFQGSQDQQYDQRYSNPSNQPYYQGQNANQGYQGQGYYDNQQNQGWNRQDPRGQQGQRQGYYENTNYSEQQPMQAYGEQKAAPDQELERKIKNALTSWFSKEYQDVSFNVNNGNVVLQGTVNSAEDKRKAEETVRKIDGVRSVNNQIVVTGAKTAWNNQTSDNASKVKEEQQKYPNDYAATDADRQLNARIREKLNGGWFSKGYDALILRTANGVVILMGSVDSNDDVKKINDQLKEVPGVRSVNNQIQVKNK